MQKGSACKKNKWNQANPAAFIIQLVAIFWLIAKIFSWKLWTSDRSFPLVPIFDFIEYSSIVHYCLFTFSIGILSFLSIKPANKLLLVALLSIELLSCAADQNRWQPWQYQYLFTIAICIIHFNAPQKIIGCIALILVSTYFYSGIGKLNEGYLAQVWDNIFLKKVFTLSNAAIQNKFIHYAGYSTAAIEILFALGLVFVKTRKMAAYGLIAMHLFILYALGPLGINNNSVIWPWNILMIALLYFIFIKETFVGFSITELWAGWNKMVLICWGILPALNYWGMWDSYLSSRLYSGNLPHLVICINSEAELKEMEPYISRNDIYNLCAGKKLIYLQQWAMKEMNVPAYPEIRVYKKIEAHWRKNHPGTTAEFIYYNVTGTKKIKRITGQ